jgi:hypothetical protein
VLVRSIIAGFSCSSFVLVFLTLAVYPLLPQQAHPSQRKLTLTPWSPVCVTPPSCFFVAQAKKGTPTNKKKERESRDPLVASRDSCIPRDRFCMCVYLAGNKKTKVREKKEDNQKKRKGKTIKNNLIYHFATNGVEWMLLNFGTPK